MLAVISNQHLTKNNIRRKAGKCKTAHSSPPDYETRNIVSTSDGVSCAENDEIAKVLECPEFLVSEVGTTPTKLDIKSEAELLNVKESGTIWVRGLNKVWDNEQFQFIFYNQSKLIKMFVRTEYINSLKNPDGNAYTKDELNRVFDTFVDSIEINGRVRLSTDNGIEGQINSYIKALTQYDDIVKHGNSNNDDELYLFAYKHMRFPLGEVVKEIRQKK